MLRTIRYLPLILVVCVLFPSWLWSQQKTSAPPMPIPDFSGAVDLTEHHPIEYQEYEKGLLTAGAPISTPTTPPEPSARPLWMAPTTIC